MCPPSHCAPHAVFPQPQCAKAIRARALPSETYLADILDCKFLVMRARVPEAVAHAQAAIARTPDVAYFYYIVTLAADHVLGLRHAKKGLKCARALTPFVRFALLHRGVDHAADMGIIALQEAAPGDVRWEEGLAFLISAWEDAKTFIEEAQPDERHMKNVINWYILLTLAIKGPEMNEDLSDLKVCGGVAAAVTLVLIFPSVRLRWWTSARRCRRSWASSRRTRRCG